MEKNQDGELGGITYTTEFRQYDPRIGRWLTIDPLFDHPDQISFSPYSFNYNIPLLFIDNHGDIPWPTIFEGITNAIKGSPFGWRTHPIIKTKQFHNGQDLPAPQGTGIRALAEGEVVKVSRSDISGNFIHIKHAKGYITKYAHIKDGGVKVKVGEYVSDGQLIAEVGSTGRSTGPHLHLIMQHNGKVIDPTSIYDLLLEVAPPIDPRILVINEEIKEIDSSIKSWSDSKKLIQNRMKLHQSRLEKGPNASWSQRIVKSDQGLIKYREGIIDKLILEKAELEIEKDFVETVNNDLKTIGRE